MSGNEIQGHKLWQHPVRRNTHRLLGDDDCWYFLSLVLSFSLCHGSRWVWPLWLCEGDDRYYRDVRPYNLLSYVFTVDELTCLRHAEPLTTHLFYFHCMMGTLPFAQYCKLKWKVVIRGQRLIMRLGKSINDDKDDYDDNTTSTVADGNECVSVVAESGFPSRAATLPEVGVSPARSAHVLASWWRSSTATVDIILILASPPSSTPAMAR